MSGGRPPRKCASCREQPVAWSNPRVDYCYACLPGGPFSPPPCRRCGAISDYYSAGLCERCHLYAPQHLGPCRDCYAWGVQRKHKWRCWGCTSWRARFPAGTCAICSRQIAVGDRGVCRLCWRQAAMRNWAQTGLSLAEANQGGQQLFLANLHQRARRAPPRVRATPAAPVPPPVGHRQLLLFDAPRDLVAGKRHGFPPPPDPQAAAALTQALCEHAARHGWGAKTTRKACRAIRILLGLQDTPGAPVKASLIWQLPTIDLPARQVHDFLVGFDLVDDDRTPAVWGWFVQQIAGLPQPMTGELRTWAEILWNGHSTHPRSRPRAQNTVQIKLRWALPTLRAWAAAGATSLREISRADVIAALPEGGNQRYTTGSGLRAIFTVLKAHKVVFVDPTAKLRLGAADQRQPLPADLAVLREGLGAPDPTRAALTALLAFHGLRSGQLRALKLTDIRDGRLHLPDRTIPLAEPVLVRLAAYLDHRNQRWPNTANPHLFIHYRTALSTKPVGPRWVGLVLGTAARDIRTDRILDEVRATGGDLRRVCDLFGLSVKAASRYTAVLDHPGLTGLNEVQTTHPALDPDSDACFPGRVDA